MNTISNIWIWIGFSIFLIVALSIDTIALKNRQHSHEYIRTSIYWTIIWVTSALVFNGLLWIYLYYNATLPIANQKSLEFFAGYLIEKSLSVDNLFTFYMIFHHFRLPIAYQQKVLSIGIWSAVILRLLLILFGAWLVSHFHWVLYLMGAFLLLTGIKMCFVKEKEKDIAETLVIKLIKRFFRVTNEIHGNKFFIRKNGIIIGTGLFLTLVFIELSDVVFALDSIPAIFAITRDPFIVWSSNIFAILGLRALYFLLAGMVNRFYLLKYGIALILVFVGSKMLIEPWIHISVLLSLTVVISILLLFTYLSLKGSKRQGISQCNQ